MSNDLVVLVIQIVVLVGAWLFGKYVTPNIPKDTITTVTNKINLIVQYADQFVSWAKQFLQDKSGPEKMDEVIIQLKKIAERYGIDITEEEIRAIAQKAYDTMKAQEKIVDNQLVTTLLPAIGEVVMQEYVDSAVKGENLNTSETVKEETTEMSEESKETVEENTENVE